MNKYYLWITIAAFFFLGVLLGMVVQQGIFQGTLIKFASNLEGVSIDVDINETLLVDRMYENMEKYGVFNISNIPEEESYDVESLEVNASEFRIFNYSKIIYGENCSLNSKKQYAIDKNSNIIDLGYGSQVQTKGELK